MVKIGLWHINAAGPQKLKEGGIDLEQYLESWIEKDPSLLQSGLKIVGRQIGVEGGRLDLLALDPQGRWVVIEIKSGTLRREIVAQALDYASCIAAMPYQELAQKVEAYLGNSAFLPALLEERGIEETSRIEDREVIIFIVGTSSDSGLERMISYLNGKFGMPVNAVLFDVFELVEGQRILVREITETEVKLPNEGIKKVTVEELCQIADKAGVGPDFRRILAAARKHNLYPRVYATSIMYASPKRLSEKVAPHPYAERAA